MDHTGQHQVVVESLAPKDLAGAMLRRSFCRRPNRSLYWPPLRTVVAAFLTAGLWPSGLLIYRLWKYATHQRFRAGELTRWLLEIQGEGEASAEPSATLRNRANGSEGASPSTLQLNAISFGAFAIAGIVWVLAVAVSILALLHFVSRGRPFVAISASAMLQLLLIFQMRMNVQFFLDRLLVGNPNRRASDIPLWSLWPTVLAIISIPVKLAGFQFAAMWIVTATAAVLASEIQRGYISVADRRLRLTVARAIGAAMYSEARR